MKKSKRMGYIEDKKLESHSENRECVCVCVCEREIERVMDCAKRSYICQRRTRSSREFETNVGNGKSDLVCKEVPQKL